MILTLVIKVFEHFIRPVWCKDPADKNIHKKMANAGTDAPNRSEAYTVKKMVEIPCAMKAKYQQREQWHIH